MRLSILTCLLILLTVLLVRAQSPSTAIDCGPGMMPVLVPQTGTSRAMVRCDPTGKPTPTPTPTPTPIPPTAGRIWYASPTGTATAQGTAASPFDIQTIFSQASVARAGDTIYLMAATFTNAAWTRTGTEAPPIANQLVCYLRGTPTLPITVMSAPGQWARVDPAIRVETTADSVIFRDFEVFNSAPDRTIERPTGMNLYGKNLKLINMVIHDCGNGVGAWTQAENLEVNGCIIYRNGWDNPADQRGSGHGIYAQSQIGTKLFKDNVAFDNYATGMKAYTENGFIIGVRFEGNILFDNGSTATVRGGVNRLENLLVGSILNPADKIEVLSNYLYHPADSVGLSWRMNYISPGRSLVFKDNYIASGKSSGGNVGTWSTLTFTGNTLINDGSNDVLMNLITGSIGFHTWGGNSYYSKHPAPFGLKIGSGEGSNNTFASWKTKTAFDAAGSFGIAPTGVKVFIRKHQHEAGRASVAVYNWDGSASVSVDLSSVLTAGQQFDVWSVRNLVVPVVSGTYAGGSVSVPVAGKFGAFLVRKR